MRIFIWVLRVLALLLLTRVILRMLFKQARRTTARPASAEPGHAGKLGGELVRDPQCGTYVTKTRAFVETVKGETVYFCSQTCRDAYLAGARA